MLFSDSERLADTARRDGVEVVLDVADDLPHVYHGALQTPEAAAAIQRIADWADNFRGSPNPVRRKTLRPER